MPSNTVEVFDLGSDGDILGSVALRRPAATALVVVDEPKRLRQPAELRQDVGVVERGAAVLDHDRRAVADIAAEQPAYEHQPRATPATSSAASVGEVPTRMPFASSASFLPCAVPDEPEMIAPACPIVLPGGAVKPAM